MSRDVYAKMADDLEAAKQRRLKEAKQKKLVKKPKKAASVVQASAWYLNHAALHDGLGISAW